MLMGRLDDAENESNAAGHHIQLCTQFDYGLSNEWHIKHIIDSTAVRAKWLALFTQLCTIHRRNRS